MAQIHFRKNQICTLIIILWEAAITFKSANAAGFEVKGILTVKTIGHENSITSERDESFDVCVSGSKWLIATAPYPYSEKADITSWEIGSEGSNEIYQVSLYNKAHLRSNSLNDSIGLVEEDMVPQNLQGNQASELWLAFASSCYLDTVTNGMLEPVYDLPDWSLRAHGYSVRADYDRFKTEPSLPKQVTYYNDKLLVLFNGKPRFIPLTAPFEQGFDRAEYKVMASTNLNGLVLPTQFSFTENAVVHTGGQAQLSTFRSVTGLVTNLVTQCNLEAFRPSLTKASYIDDRRFDAQEKPVGSLGYMITNGIWPLMSSDFLQGLYQHEIYVREHMVNTIIMSPTDSGQHPKASIVVIILLFVPAAIFLVFVVFVLIRHLNTNRGKNINRK